LEVLRASQRARFAEEEAVDIVYELDNQCRDGGPVCTMHCMLISQNMYGMRQEFADRLAHRRIALLS